MFFIMVFLRSHLQDVLNIWNPTIPITVIKEGEKNYGDMGLHGKIFYLARGKEKINLYIKNDFGILF